VLIATTLVLGTFVAVWVTQSKSSTSTPSAAVTNLSSSESAESSASVSSSSGAPPVTVEPGSTVVQGQLTFRGNATRTLYGQGPVPMHPKVLWTYPDKGMCSQSHDLAGFAEWCGTGWTGEPAVWERDGKTMVAFGAYDDALHVLDASNGTDLFTPFKTGDLIKGSVSVDPDGYPLIYSG